MTETTNDPQDFLAPKTEKPALPSGINVLTILTFIGCGIGALFTLCSPMLIRFSMRMMDKAMEGGNLSEKRLTEIARQRPKMELMLDNMWPLILIGLAGIALCLYGALQMRKLKKEGFYVYVLGQILPVIGSGLLVGFSAQFNGPVSYVFAAIPVVFIILYANQLKYMK